MYIALPVELPVASMPTAQKLLMLEMGVDLQKSLFRLWSCFGVSSTKTEMRKNFNSESNSYARPHLEQLSTRPFCRSVYPLPAVPHSSVNQLPFSQPLPLPSPFSL